MQLNCSAPPCTTRATKSHSHTFCSSNMEAPAAVVALEATAVLPAVRPAAVPQVGAPLAADVADRPVDRLAAVRRVAAEPEVVPVAPGPEEARQECRRPASITPTISRARSSLSFH